MDLTGQRIAILGAARSGLAAARLAALHGASVTVFDEGNVARHTEFAMVIGDDARAAVIAEGSYDLAVLSPGFDVAWPLPAKFSTAGIPLTGELEFACTFSHPGLIAITGTNGKSTTTEIIAAMLNGIGLRSIECGNHGMALSEVLHCGQSFDQLALEVSSFQLETIATFKPRIALWLNFAPDHLDRYPDEAAYFAAKHRIFMNQDASDHAIVNVQDLARVGPLKSHVHTFSAYGPADFTYTNGAFHHRGQIIADASKLKLRGRHNMENVLAALAVGHVLGLDFAALMHAIEAYVPPRHRCELVRDRAGVEFINDSKATNLHALESCVKALDRQLVLIMGGKEKGLDYTPLRDQLPGKVRQLITLGEIGDALAQQFDGIVPTTRATSMAHAVQLSARAAQPGDAVVLSPGTSSFDMYSGYAARGDDFRAAVLSLD
jgi:UDP-N-acetylmuramoylalanine--D-glutamate ligase